MVGEVLGDYCDGGEEYKGETETKEEALREEELVVVFAEGGHKEGEYNCEGAGCEEDLFSYSQLC